MWTNRKMITFSTSKALYKDDPRRNMCNSNLEHFPPNAKYLGTAWYNSSSRYLRYCTKPVVVVGLFDRHYVFSLYQITHSVKGRDRWMINDRSCLSRFTILLVWEAHISSLWRHSIVQCYCSSVLFGNYLPWYRQFRERIIMPFVQEVCPSQEQV